MSSGVAANFFKVNAKENYPKTLKLMPFLKIRYLKFYVIRNIIL